MKPKTKKFQRLMAKKASAKKFKEQLKARRKKQK